jgi:hypothetical protein
MSHCKSLYNVGKARGVPAELSSGPTAADLVLAFGR